MAESKLSTPASRFRWDAFLSFRGEDTSKSFTEKLYNELVRNNIRVFRDNDGMHNGASLDTVFDAIEDSAASIAIISPNYASSRWCLEELSRIRDCGRRILPVFYHVDPSDVRRQKGEFEEYMRNHQIEFGDEIVSKWKSALTEVGALSGFVFQNWDGVIEVHEEKLVFVIVKNILDEVTNTPLLVSQYTVGLEYPLEEVMKLLDVKCKDIRVLGLHGTGGIGKTTLSKALYNKLAGHFEYRSFISNVRETCAKQEGILQLQNQLLKDLSSSSSSPSPYVKDIKAGISAIKRITYEKKVVIVFDDIDDASQLNALAGAKESFFEGSRIIINTRNVNVLMESNLITATYEVKELGASDASKLFTYHALRRETPTSEFLKLSKQFVSLTGKLPLAVEVFGSSLLHKRTVKEWEDTLQKLKEIRPESLQAVLKISFDSLREQEKCVFLDISCIFLGLKLSRDEASDVINGCGFDGETILTVLVEKSLVKVIDGDLRMHDQIRDMGRQIVLLEENVADPGMRTRLWNHDEILGVLGGMLGTGHIQGITLNVTSNISPKDRTSENLRRIARNDASAFKHVKNMYDKYYQRGAEDDEWKGLVLSTAQFKEMATLRLLQLGDVKLEGDFRHLPSKIKWLQWKNCPLNSIPLLPASLTVLDLSESRIEKVPSESRIERVWNTYNKVAKNLVVLNLYGCFNLTSVPDLSGHPCLEKLILERCKKLAAIHKSIGHLNSLKILNLKYCSSLLKFPSDVSGLKRLETLILSGCSQLKELPENIGCMISLTKLLIDETAIWKLPDSILRLTTLQILTLNRCESFKRLPFHIGKLDSLKEFSLNNSALEEIPDSIGQLKNLETLSLMWCKSLVSVPDSIGDLMSLTEIRLGSSSVKKLPDSIGSLHYLKSLSIGHCRNLTALPFSIKSLASMVEMDLDGTSIEDLPEHIAELKSLKTLEMRNCESLKSLPHTFGKLLSLNTLIITNAAIVELPESFAMLEDLIMLRLNKCKLLRKLPDKFGNLKNLHHLYLEETGVTKLPENFGMLSKLIILEMAKKSDQAMPHSVELPLSFSNLSKLTEFDARRWNMSGKLPDNFEKLLSLEILKLDYNDFCSLPSSMAGLSNLTKFTISNCKKLKIIPPLPSSLELFDATNCIALETISDVSNLVNLVELQLTNCDKLLDIPGIGSLNSLRRLYMGGCTLCSSAVIRKLDKIAYRKLFNLSIPGSEIPNWFTPKEVIYSKRKNSAIKAIVFAVVVSINHQIEDERRDQIPVIADIQAKLVRSNTVVVTSVLNLQGVTNTNKDQVFMCRYQEYTGFFLWLEDGDKIEISMRDPPWDKGVELKNSGIQLIYENDDDYGGDEKSLDETQQSTSHKLKEFLESSEDVQLKPDLVVAEGGVQLEELVQPKCSKFYPVSIILSCFIALLSFLIFKYTG